MNEVETWKEQHGIRQSKPVQGDLFGAGAVGDAFALRAASGHMPMTIAERRAIEKRAADLDARQERFV